jgi:glutamate-1-semialdehyde aminotransferase
MAEKLNLENSEELFNEALKLIPVELQELGDLITLYQGNFQYLRIRKRWKSYCFDGNEYIDMLCAYGPIIIGHREEKSIMLL